MGGRGTPRETNRGGYSSGDRPGSHQRSQGLLIHPPSHPASLLLRPLGPFFGPRRPQYLIGDMTAVINGETKRRNASLQGRREGIKQRGVGDGAPRNALLADRAGGLWTRGADEKVPAGFAG